MQRVARSPHRLVAMVSMVTGVHLASIRPADFQRDIRVIATDMDGTLLNSRHEMPTSAQKLFEKAKEKGIVIVPVTGRGRLSASLATRHVGDEVGFKLNPAVFHHGLECVGPSGETIFSMALPPGIVPSIIKMTKSEWQPLEVMVYCGDVVLGQSPAKWALPFCIKYSEPPLIICDDLVADMAARGLEATRMTIVGSAEDIQRFRPQIDAAIANQPVNCRLSLPVIMDITPAGMNKAIALQRLLDLLEVDKSQVLAIGDGENDIELLRFAGTSVAMGNAMEIVKQSAQFVTASNDDDGWARAVSFFTGFSLDS